MLNDTQLPHSVPTALQGKTREEFQGGKNKVLELLNTLDLEDFLNQFTQQILPLQAAQWFALDCAKLVLYAFEELHPDDKRISNCIEVVESYLNVKSNLKAFSIADPDARDVYYAAYSALDAAANAGLSAAYAVHYAGLSAARYGRTAARYAAYSAADAASKDEMQAFVKNWIDNYFDTK